MSGRIHIYELRCPECTAELNGVSGDRLFVCGSCAGVFAAGDGRLTRQSLYIAQPVAAADGELFFLPFWRFRISVCVLDAKHVDITASTGAKTLGSVWVPAFYEVRPNVFGNPGLNLSLARPTPEATLWPAETPIRLNGAARRSEDAAVYVQPFVAGILDREKDISGLTIDVQTQSSEYWAIPFSFDQVNRQVRDLLCGEIYSMTVVERINEIMNC